VKRLVNVSKVVDKKTEVPWLWKVGVHGEDILRGSVNGANWVDNGAIHLHDGPLNVEGFEEKILRLLEALIEDGGLDIVPRGKMTEARVLDEISKGRRFDKWVILLAVHKAAENFQFVFNVLDDVGVSWSIEIIEGNAGSEEMSSAPPGAGNGSRDGSCEE
jgi:hypothetical protein